MRDTRQSTDAATEAVSRPPSPSPASPVGVFDPFEASVFSAIAGHAPEIGPPPPSSVSLRELANTARLRRWCAEQFPQLTTAVTKRLGEARARVAKRAEPQRHTPQRPRFGH
jgi:hypothetical protein